MLIFYFPHSIYIFNLKNFVVIFIPHIFIYSIIHLYQYGLMDIYFILWTT